MNNTFSEAIKQIRKEKALSQQQLADLIQVDRTTVTNWEKGRRLPDVNMIAKISNTFGINASYLINVPPKQSDSLNVIMVDDEKIILTGSIPVLQNTLPHAAVKGFTKPSEALKFARENTVSLAFLDIEMGNVSGLDLCKELLSINPHTNVVFLTAYVKYSFDAWDTGACGFLLKPISESEVGKLLGKLRYPF